MVKKIQDLPDWLRKRYSILSEAFGEKTFSREDAIKILEEKNKDVKKQVSVFISELRKAGIVEIYLDPIDSRRRNYKLKPIKEILKEEIAPLMEIIEEKLIEKDWLTREDLDAILKEAADLIRTRVDYKFILILLFLKRISDKWQLEYEIEYKKAIADELSKKEAETEAANSTYHDFDMPKEYLWDNLRKDVNKLPEKFSQALKALAERNPELKDVLDRADFIQFTRNTENAEILRQLVELFSAKKLHNVSADILGEAYEWVLRYFAPTKAKEGEIYTPREVIRLMVEILDPKPGNSVYDPCCGSGGMLILSYMYVLDKLGPLEAKKIFLYGQEANQITHVLSKMNLYIHDIRDAEIRFGDTLSYPKFLDGDSIKKFDIVLANPPWNQDGYHETVIKKGNLWKERFTYGIGPKTTADWVWIQHMIASVKEDGKVAVVIDTGCLMREGREESIREQILKDDLIESIILLPEKLFYNTNAPGTIIIFNKNKPETLKNKIHFINATSEYEEHPNIKTLNIMTNNNIATVSHFYKSREEEFGFSQIIPMSDIEDNEYALSTTIYVFPDVEIEEINIPKKWNEIVEKEREVSFIEERIKSFFNILNEEGYNNPSFTDTDYGRVPEHWKIIRLGDILESVSLKVKDFGKKIEEIPVLSMTRYEGLILQKDKFTKRVASKDITNYKVIKKDQICYGFPMDEGVIYALKTVEFGAVSPVYSVWKLKDTAMDINYLDFLLRSPKMIREYRKYCAHTVERRRIIKERFFKKIKTAIPPLSEQKKIAKILLDINNKNNLEMICKKKYKRIQQALINDLITGRKKLR